MAGQGSKCVNVLQKAGQVAAMRSSRFLPWEGKEVKQYQEVFSCSFFRLSSLLMAFV